MVINDFIIDYFLFEFGWNQLKNIVIKWTFLITAEHTHLFNDRFIPFVHSLFTSSTLTLSTLSGLLDIFVDHRNPIFDLYNLLKVKPNHAFKYTYKMFMFRRFLRS